MNLPVGRAD